MNYNQDIEYLYYIHLLHYHKNNFQFASVVVLPMDFVDKK